MPSRNVAAEEVPAGTREARDPAFHVVLKPLSHPELGEIRIEDELFAIGRTEQPFASYGRALAAEISRRHARIFAERGTIYVADLGSKNGTTVNGSAVRQRPQPLRQGDELRFGADLSYRVELVASPPRAPHPPVCLCLTLVPERNDLGLQPIVITRFPFLVSKADEAFSRYREAYPHQVNYISRRHAHIFLKGGAPFVEDLGSTNGTFVDGQRLDEHAVPLAEGKVVAFGGTHFVYRVSLQEASEATLTGLMKPSEGAAAAPLAADADKTTFVAAADSFLDIFCVDSAPPPEDEPDDAADPAAAAGTGAEAARPRARWAIFLSEVRDAFGRSEAQDSRRLLKWGGAVVAVLVAGALGLYLWGAPQRDMADRLASGDYTGAALAAHEYLARHPEDAAVQALGTEALLRAGVPDWMAALNAGQFDRAAAALAAMQTQAAANADAQPLVRELVWIGDLQRFVAGRGGLDAPIPVFGNSDPVRALVQRWEDDPGGHQRALTRIAAFVPAFRDQYAQALSQLRKLESDDAVYRTAIERLQTTIRSKLEGGQPGELGAVFDEYAEKYPRLAGIDALRQDLASYRRIDSDTRAGSLGARIARFQQAQLATPVFQEQLARLKASRLPAAEILDRYNAAREAWRKGAAAEAIASLEALAAGPAGGVVADELALKKSVATQFEALQKARGGEGYRERLIAFYAALDPAEDAHFAAAVEPEVAASRAEALDRAKALLVQAQTQWGQYQRDGAIGGEQRRENPVSVAFRAQARLLSRAQEGVRQGLRILTLLKAQEAAQWGGLRDEVDAEVERQRQALLELSGELPPEVLKAKLELIGGRSDEGRGPSP